MYYLRQCHCYWKVFRGKTNVIKLLEKGKLAAKQPIFPLPIILTACLFCLFSRSRNRTATTRAVSRCGRYLLFICLFITKKCSKEKKKLERENRWENSLVSANSCVSGNTNFKLNSTNFKKV